MVFFFIYIPSGNWCQRLWMTLQNNPKERRRRRWRRLKTVRRCDEICLSHRCTHQRRHLNGGNRLGPWVAWVHSLSLLLSLFHLFFSLFRGTPHPPPPPPPLPTDPINRRNVTRNTKLSQHFKLIAMCTLLQHCKFLTETQKYP